MSGHKGLDKWFKQDWRDIGSKKKDGTFAKCGRAKHKARAMSKGQIKSAVSRKRSKAQGVGGKPTNVKTFASKRKSLSMGGMV